MVGIGIDGFGRIARILTRMLVEHHAYRRDFRIVALRMRPEDDLASRAKDLLNDEIYGPWVGHRVEYGEHELVVDGISIPIIPDGKPWDDIDIAVIATRGVRRLEDFKQRAIGSKRALITKPLAGVDKTFVYFINCDEYQPVCHLLCSAASCTTTAAVSVLHPLLKNFGPFFCSGITVHAATSSQEVMRTLNQILPAATGASQAVEVILPALAGKTDFFAIRAPHVSASWLRLSCVFWPGMRPPLQSVIDALREAESTYLRGILKTEWNPLSRTNDSSGEHKGEEHAAIINCAQITPCFDWGYHIPVWYDNEKGFVGSNLVRLVVMMAACQRYEQMVPLSDYSFIPEGGGKIGGEDEVKQRMDD